ncbi:Fic family protein [Hymenobacter daeguensis]
MPDFAALTRLKADLDALGPLPAEQLGQAQVAWTFAAGAPAGHALTRPDTEALLLHGLTAAGQPLAVKLALRQHHAAVQYLEAVVSSGQPLTEAVLGALHARLLGLPADTHRPYKTHPNDGLTAAGTVRYHTQPADVPARLAELLAWYARAAGQHPVARAAGLHHRFLRISPFAVGNGRLAHLLLGLALRQHGYPAAVIAPADEDRYQTALAAADAGEPAALQALVAETVAAALRQQLRAARGEPAYAPDDLQARLAGLRQRVLAREDAVATLWNAELQATVYDVLLRPWLADVQLQTQGFDELFMSRGYSGGVAPVVLDEEGDWHSFEAQLLAAVAGTRAALEEVQFAKKWLHFRQRHNGFDVGVRVAFRFHSDHFTVQHALFSQHSPTGPEALWQEEVFSSAYLPAYNYAHFHEINHQLAARLYDFVAARLAAAEAAAS